MNISGVTNLIWLGSILAGGYLGYFLYDFKQNEGELMKYVDNEVYLEALQNNIVVPEIEELREYDFDVVKSVFHEMNWTGEPPKKPVVVEKPTEKPKPVQKKPVKDILTVMYMRAATFDPASSQAHVLYKDPQINTVDGKTETLLIGDHLPKPHESIVIQDITAKGVLFAFEGDEEREPELLRVPVVDDGLTIVEVGPDGEIKPPTLGGIGVVKEAPAYRPENTVLVRKDYYLIGTNDAAKFNVDYASIIAQVDHARHRDPVTRQYDGIEIKSVPSNSIAAAHGVKSGDVIKSINGHPVTSPQEAIQYAKNNSDKYTTWEIVIENKGVLRTVTYETPDE